MRSTLVTATVFLFASVSATYAQSARVFDFLRGDASARSAAMGGAFVTIVNDPVGMFYNPALINAIDSTQVSFTFLKHVLDINSGDAALATSIDGIGRVGFGVVFTSYGSFTRTDRTGRQLGEFSSNDIAAQIGWGTMLGEGISAGISGKAIFSTIDSYSSMALALDGGLLYVDTSRRVQIGLSLMHLGSQVSTFDGLNEELPLDLKIGVSHSLRGLPLLIALNFSRLLDDTDQFQDRFSSFSVGGEFTIAQPVRLRFGYNNRVRQDVTFGESKGLAGLSAGLGLIVKGYRIDYGFNSLAGVGALHRVSINTGF